jgi:prevent-host-death family protein
VTRVSLADAKARLSALVEQAANGETVQITRRGKIVAQITPVQSPKKPIELAALRAVTDTMQPQSESAATFIRTMRDEDRF